MDLRRASGILLHPTSLPGRFGMGDLGPEAYNFADFLADTGQSLWQILPLGHTSYGNSPYMCLSAFGGNPYLISLERLVNEGLLAQTEIENPPDFPKGMFLPIGLPGVAPTLNQEIINAVPVVCLFL